MSEANLAFASPTRIGFGVVGINQRVRRTILGGITASRRAQLAAICSRDPIKAAQTVAEFGGKPYTAYALLLADPAVDAVFICTPHALHHPMALAALRAGKMVVCEKPLAISSAEADELAEEAEQSGLPNLVNFTYHSLSGQRFVERLLQDGAIGTLRQISCSYWQARQRLPGAAPGDALLDVGSHLVDLVEWWGAAAGAGTIEAVTGQDLEVAGHRGIGFAALARTDQGALIALQANRGAAGWKNAMNCHLIGELGSLSLTFDTDTAQVAVARFGEGGPEGVPTIRPLPPDLAVSYADFPAFHIDRLTAALLGEIDFPDFAYGRRCQRVLEAVQTSMRASMPEKRWIGVADQ